MKIQKLLRSALPIPPKTPPNLTPIDYVFITQYYKNGGAERVINNYILALRTLHPNLKIAIVSTDFDDNETWESGIPTGVNFIKFFSCNLSRPHRIKLLKKTLKILNPSTIHIVNSKVALDLIAKTPPTQPLAGSIYLSLFNSDLSPSGQLTFNAMPQ